MMKGLLFLVAVVTFTVVALAAAEEDDDWLTWDEMDTLEFGDDLTMTWPFQINPELEPECRVALNEDEELLELRCRWEGEIDNDEDEEEDEEEDDDDDDNDDITSQWLCCNDTSSYECPLTEKEALYQLWEAASGEQWENALGRGWRRFTLEKPEAKWKDACDDPDDFPSGAYYDSNYDGLLCKSGKIVEIDLSSNHMLGCISPAIGCFTEAKNINLSDNRLKKCVPTTIGNLKNALQYLDISSNRLKRLPDEICANRDICKSLLIGDNPWKSTPDCLEEMSDYCTEETDF